jgi:hypothetical protein
MRPFSAAIQPDETLAVHFHGGRGRGFAQEEVYNFSKAIAILRCTLFTLRGWCPLVDAIVGGGGDTETHRD